MPEYLTEAQYRTARAVIDVMIPATARVLDADTIASRADRFLGAARSPKGAQIRLALFMVEWLVPLLAWRLPPFSRRSATTRRKVLERLVRGGGVLRDLARTLRLLAVFSYYTHSDARRTIGYVDMERRPRYSGLDPTPRHYASQQPRP